MRFEDKQLFRFLDAVIKADMELTRMQIIQLTGQIIGHGAEEAMMKKYVDDGWIYSKEVNLYGITKPGRGKHEELEFLIKNEWKPKVIKCILFWAAVIAAITGVIALFRKG